MKSILIPIMTLFFIPTIYSQQIYSDTTWERWYGVQNYKEGLATANHHIEHYDMGYLFHAYNGSPDEYNAVIKKTDINGHFLWERLFDPLFKHIILAIKKYDDGGVIICGGSYETGVSNPWVTKLNACMEIEWCKRFDWPNFSYAIDAEIDQNGDIVVLTAYYGESPSERINLIKLDEDGAIIWKEDFATIEDYPYIWNADPRNLIISDNNDYYIAGDAEWPTNNDPTQGGGNRTLIIKANSDGEEEWVLPFGIYDQVYGFSLSLHQLNEHTFMANTFNYGNLNPLILKFNEFGDVLSYETKSLMADTYVSNYFISTNVLDENTFFSIWRHRFDMSEPNYNGYMVYDSLLNIIDYMEFPDLEMPCSLVHTFNNKMLSVAKMKESDKTTYYDIYLSKRNIDFTFDTVYSNWNESYDSLCEGGVVSGYLSYTCDDIVGINDTPTPEEHQEAQQKIDISISPNPANNEVLIEFENQGELKDLVIVVFNTAGRKQLEKSLKPYEYELPIDIKNWPRGVYFVVVQSEGRFVGNAKLVVE